MTMTGLDGIVDDYLSRLDTALLPLPAAEREQIVAEITEHIAQARATLPTQSEAAVRDLLDRLGDPEVIAAAALVDQGSVPEGRHRTRTRRRTVLLVVAVILLAAITIVVYLAQNGDSGTVTVPNVVDQSVPAAVRALRADGLLQGSTIVESSATVPAGFVITTSPPAATSVKSGSMVTLTVSQG
jgi:uncharacterized membrane protein